MFMNNVITTILDAVADKFNKILFMAVYYRSVIDLSLS